LPAVDGKNYQSAGDEKKRFLGGERGKGKNEGPAPTWKGGCYVVISCRAGKKKEKNLVRGRKSPPRRKRGFGTLLNKPSLPAQKKRKNFGHEEKEEDLEEEGGIRFGGGGD